ncbi:MAG: hypothetical protein ACJ72A_06810, partial [Nocardioidaceae bacterium]
AARNDILTAVMRRPWPVVASTVVETLGRGAIGRRAVAQALLRSPRAMKHRRPVPGPVEQARRLLDDPA